MEVAGAPILSQSLEQDVKEISKKFSERMEETTKRIFDNLQRDLVEIIDNAFSPVFSSIQLELKDIKEELEKEENQEVPEPETSKEVKLKDLKNTIGSYTLSNFRGGSYGGPNGWCGFVGREYKATGGRNDFPLPWVSGRRCDFAGGFTNGGRGDRTGETGGLPFASGVIGGCVGNCSGGGIFGFRSKKSSNQGPRMMVSGCRSDNSGDGRSGGGGKQWSRRCPGDKSSDVCNSLAGKPLEGMFERGGAGGSGSSGGPGERASGGDFLGGKAPWYLLQNIPVTMGYERSLGSLVGLERKSEMKYASKVNSLPNKMFADLYIQDPDDSLKRKTFELLYKMTKSSNVEVIVDRMIEYMISINDSHYKTEIASRCVELAEQFAPSNQWFIQTMNKVFEHAGDLVNIKVVHNLMRLIAEGFGEEDDTADGQLRLSAVESYLRIIGEPKLPSAFLQVICWVLGEYGIAYGKYSASYITGKLCDVAEAYSTDDTVKAYALTALMKIYAFEKAAGRKVDMLPECQSLIEELSASHSTDLQQRAYELQAVIGLDSQAIETILPFDASCEDIEVDKSLSFLNGYVQKSLENGAQPYVSENQHSAMPIISNFRSQTHHESSAHGLRFEAYELPKPIEQPKPTLASHVPSTDLVSVSEPSYTREFHQAASVRPLADAGSNEIKLRLDGVQKKWGRPNYSSPPSTSNSSSQNVSNGGSQNNEVGAVSSKPRDTSYGYKKQTVEIDPEKQRLAASLFGGLSKEEKRPSTTSYKSTKTSSHVGKSQETRSAAEMTPPPPPPPDLLDFGEPDNMGGSSIIDPFTQLEGLLEAGPGASSAANSSSVSSTKESDLMSLYGDMPMSTQSDFVDTLSKDDNLNFGSSDATNKNGHVQQSQESKGPNLKDALQKDALVRQMGVTPTSQNPNLFKDLFG
uniref:Clathrin/coatomer adaptor adaptin-like N-terminal domain-containing protein n=1 Tax=Chenopodium quinoa TaxID=63459 RepID=A0A803MK26_CHEQI